tara:strand:+ start:341 stop:478 length:138 start_codon:yes stop_codon:yes gene_type:complete
MNTKELTEELDLIIEKLKLKLIYYQIENDRLKKRLSELKQFVKEK